MSYMGPRYMGGGQIYPQAQSQNQPQNQNQRQNQNQPYQSQHFRNMQQQLQMVQMHLQNSMQNQSSGKLNQNAKNTGPDNSKGKGTTNANSTPDLSASNDKNKTNKNQPEIKDKNQSTNQNKNQTNSQTNTKQEIATPGKGSKQDNFDSNKGPMKSRFGNSPQDSTKSATPQQSTNQQQGSLMGQPPPLMNTPNIKREFKNSPNQPQRNMNEGPYKNTNDFNASNQHNNSFENQDQSKQGQQQQQGFRGGRFGKGPQGGGMQNQRNTPQQFDQQDRSGRNMNSRQNDNRGGRGGTPLGGRSGGRGGSQQHSGGGRGSGKGYYYGGDKVKEKLAMLFTEPQIDLPPMDMNEKKFNNHAKLFIGNIPKNCEQKEIVALFEQFGEIGSVYLNKDSSFAFINFDYKANATKALRELDNTLVKNRHLKVRFATISEGIRVKNLSPTVSNELLEKAFSIFGMIESCRVSVDERGLSKGVGVIIFRDKKSAVMATKKCQEECFFLSGALRPVVVTTLEPPEDLSEGLPETSLPRNEDYRNERDIVPHFAEPNSFEFEFGLQWKQLFNMYEEKKSVLDRDFQIELERLEKKMVLAKVEYETDKLRKELAQREAESAELRRHFDYESGNNYNNQAIGASPGAGGANYDPYPGSKRPLDQGYDGSFNTPYDPAYSDNYDRATGYAPSDYDRNYDQGYGGYGRDDYRREGGYGPEDPYDRPYDHPTDMPQERKPIFDNPADPGYVNKPPEPPLTGEPFKAPSKRPRY